MKRAFATIARRGPLATLTHEFPAGRLKQVHAALRRKLGKIFMNVQVLESSFVSGCH